LNVLGTVQAGVAHELYGRLDWILKQVFPDTADGENLDRWSQIWGVLRKAAVPAQGYVTITGTPGTEFDAGLVWARSDTAEFKNDTGGTIGIDGTVIILFTADLAGTAGITEAGDTLTLTTPTPGIDSAATVGPLGLTGGADEETDADLLSRLLQRIQNPPHGGALSDYVGWLLELAGVTRAWGFSWAMGPGTVGLTFVKDNDPISIIPTVSDLSASATYLDGHTDPATSFEVGRNVTAKVFLYAPEILYMNPTIAISPDNPDTRAAVQTELEDLLKRSGGPGETTTLAEIDDAVGFASGVESHNLVLPTSDFVVATNKVGQVGTISWV
jgi:uncharacterized phage protein gp47/JayE